VISNRQPADKITCHPIMILIIRNKDYILYLSFIETFTTLLQITAT